MIVLLTLLAAQANCFTNGGWQHLPGTGLINELQGERLPDLVDDGATIDVVFDANLLAQDQLLGLPTDVVIQLLHQSILDVDSVGMHRHLRFAGTSDTAVCGTGTDDDDGFSRTTIVISATPPGRPACDGNDVACAGTRVRDGALHCGRLHLQAGELLEHQPALSPRDVAALLRHEWLHLYGLAHGDSTWCEPVVSASQSGPVADGRVSLPVADLRSLRRGYGVVPAEIVREETTCGAAPLTTDGVDGVAFGPIVSADSRHDTYGLSFLRVIDQQPFLGALVYDEGWIRQNPTQHPVEHTPDMAVAYRNDVPTTWALAHLGQDTRVDPDLDIRLLVRDDDGSAWLESDWHPVRADTSSVSMAWNDEDQRYLVTSIDDGALSLSSYDPLTRQWTGPFPAPSDGVYDVDIACADRCLLAILPFADDQRPGTIQLLSVSTVDGVPTWGDSTSTGIQSIARPRLSASDDSFSLLSAFPDGSWTGWAHRLHCVNDTADPGVEVPVAPWVAAPMGLGSHVDAGQTFTSLWSAFVPD